MRPAATPSAMLDHATALELHRQGRWEQTCPWCYRHTVKIQGGPEGLTAHVRTVHPEVLPNMT